jgi:hypothetical protein
MAQVSLCDLEGFDHDCQTLLVTELRKNLFPHSVFWIHRRQLGSGLMTTVHSALRTSGFPLVETQPLKNGIIGNLPASPAWVREVNGMRLCKGTTEGPRRVRQLDGAFLFGHERIVAKPEVILNWLPTGLSTFPDPDRPETRSWRFRICRHPAKILPMTRERWAQIGITTQFLIVVRTLGEIFRLRHVHGTNFSAAIAMPYVGGALIAGCSCWVSSL